MSTHGEFRTKFDKLKASRETTEKDYYVQSVEISELIALAKTTRADMVSQYKLYRLLCHHTKLKHNIDKYEPQFQKSAQCL